MVLGFSLHMLKASGEDQASTGVPPQSVAIKPKAEEIKCNNLMKYGSEYNVDRNSKNK